jgi:hypothetical protein
MCRPLKCDNCGKMTWEGCGLHVEEALAGIPEDQICECDAEQLEWVPALKNG